MKLAIVFLILIGFSTLESKTCYSDFDCGFGQSCTKFNYDSKGICTDVVDQNGVKDYNRQPNPNSININDGKGTCQFNTDCPYGFSCLKKDGGIYGYCIK